MCPKYLDKRNSKICNDFSDLNLPFRTQAHMSSLNNIYSFSEILKEKKYTNSGLTDNFQ